MERVLATTDGHDQRIRDIADRVLWLEDGAFRDIVRMATDPVCNSTT